MEGIIFFIDIEPRVSIDYLLNKDLSYGALKELFLLLISIMQMNQMQMVLKLYGWD